MDFVQRFLHFLVARPDVGEHDRLAVLAGAERFLGQVDVQRAGDRVGDDERWRGEEVHPYFGVHAALEVAVAGQHRAGGDIAGFDGSGDFRLQRAGVADAGGASISHDIESQCGQVTEHAGLVK